MSFCPVYSICPMVGKLQGTYNVYKNVMIVNYVMPICKYNVLPYSSLHVYFSLVNEGFICHEQCDSVTSCWGSNDTQCEGCRNFRYLRRCVQNCSVVSLPANSRWGSTCGHGRVWSCESVRVWECECVSARVWECECESVLGESVRVWLWECESESVNVVVRECGCVSVRVCMCWWITCWLHVDERMSDALYHYPALYTMSG